MRNAFGCTDKTKTLWLISRESNPTRKPNHWKWNVKPLLKLETPARLSPSNPDVPAMKKSPEAHNYPQRMKNNGHMIRREERNKTRWRCDETIPLCCFHIFLQLYWETSWGNAARLPHLADCYRVTIFSPSHVLVTLKLRSGNVKHDNTGLIFAPICVGLFDWVSMSLPLRQQKIHSDPKYIHNVTIFLNNKFMFPIYYIKNKYSDILDPTKTMCLELA